MMFVIFFPPKVSLCDGGVRRCLLGNRFRIRRDWEGGGAELRVRTTLVNYRYVIVLGWASKDGHGFYVWLLI